MGPHTMQPAPYSPAFSLQLVVTLTSSFVFIHHSCLAFPISSSFSKRDDVPLILDYSPAPPPEDGPPGAAGALRDPAYLPAQIGGIVGSYALSLVIVAALLLRLAKTRRERLQAAEEDLDEYEIQWGPDQYDPEFASFYIPHHEQVRITSVPYPLSIPKSPVRNYSYPQSPEDDKEPTPYVLPTSSPQSLTALGINLDVDQHVVAADREMAQDQLEQMYKYVMEQEEAKENGIVLEHPPAPILKQQPSTTSLPKSGGFLKKSKKPANLDLDNPARPEPEKQSRASALLSAFKSPRKKHVKGMSISSPIMTPMSGTFPRQEGAEMETIPPRYYVPAPPPPVPADPQYVGGRNAAPVTPPDVSPQSIDERLGVQMVHKSHSRHPSVTLTEADPVSAASESSTTPLVGLPASPRANRFPSLPSSPRPGATFARPNPPSAVRTDGSLPLRAYEPSFGSPTAQTATKQTVFERAPLSPGGMRTPYTGTAVPYSPYQPHTPVMPMSPTLVTKKDRKRMKSLMPKTPTLEMVKSDDEIW